jgi:N-acetylglucosamine-6-phosphate deacetylase
MRLGVSASVVDGALIDGDVEVADGLINAVGIGGSVGRGIALPGFIDVHTHGYRGVDFARATEAEMSEASVALTATGVTAFQPTLITMEIDEMREAAAIHARAGYPGARFLGTHFEGPFLSPDYPGAHRPELLRLPDLTIARGLSDVGMAQMTLAPELDRSIELIQFLVSEGTVISLGHSNADAVRANTGFDAGARALTHVFNASRPMGHRDPGIIGAALSRDDVFITAIFDGIHLSREAASVVVRVAGDRLVAITDAMAAAGMGPGSYELGNQLVNVSDGEARLGDGTIASSVLTMDQAFRSLVELGLTVAEAATATSSAPASMCSRADLGRINPGQAADMVIVDDGFFVMRTVVGGNEVFSS